MVKAYFRCNGGDYFNDQSCPFDGWSSPDLNEFRSASEFLRSRGMSPSLAAFRSLGLSTSALNRIIVVEYGSDLAAFDALSPGNYIKDGVERKLGNLGPDLT